jgi:hypothetical protein
LVRAALTAWKNATSSADPQGRLVRHGEGKRLGQLPHHPERAVPAILLHEDVLLRPRHQAEALGRRARRPLRSVEAVEQPAAHLVLRQHEGDRLLLVDGGLARPAALGVGGKRRPELVGEPQVVHDEAARLVPEHAVHARDRMHEAVPAHRLVEVHRGE